MFPQTAQRVRLMHGSAIRSRKSFSRVPFLSFLCHPNKATRYQHFSQAYRIVVLSYVGAFGSILVGEKRREDLGRAERRLKMAQKLVGIVEKIARELHVFKVIVGSSFYNTVFDDKY